MDENKNTTDSMVYNTVQFVGIVNNLGLDNEGEPIKLDETALYKPISYDGVPIGHIVQIDEENIIAAFWTKDWEYVYDDFGNFIELELKTKPQITFEINGDTLL